MTATEKPVPKNQFAVGLQGESILVLFPVQQRLTKAEALGLAAWLVALADDTGGVEFAEMLEAVQNT